jgi:hypothetical protein
VRQPVGVFYAPIDSHSVALASAAGVLHDVRRRVSPSAQSLSEEVVVREGGRRDPAKAAGMIARAQPPRAARGVARAGACAQRSNFAPCACTAEWKVATWARAASGFGAGGVGACA